MFLKIVKVCKAIVSAMEVELESMAKVNHSMVDEVIREFLQLERCQVTNFLTKITHPKTDNHRKT